MRETVDQRIENDGRLGQECWDGSRQGRQFKLSVVIVVFERTELANQTDNGVRCPGSETQKGQRQNDQGRPDVSLSASFTERHCRFTERCPSVTGHDEPGHFPGRTNDEPEDGRITKCQNGDGQNEAEDKQIQVVETVGQCPRSVVPRTGNQNSFRLIGRPAKEPRRSHQSSAMKPNSGASLSSQS